MRYILALFICLFASAANAAIVTKDVTYYDGALKLIGTVAYDDIAQGVKPGIVLYPEWWGNNAYAKSRAKELAAKGYIVFVADMYGNGASTTSATEAKTFTDPLYTNREVMRTRARAAIRALKEQMDADNSNIAAIGFCFGGTVALELARKGEDLKGVGVFHAGLKFPESTTKGAVKAKVLVMNGSADPMVPEADRDAFIDDMQNSGADVQFIQYSGAMHAFTNPSANSVGIPGVAYDQKSERRSFIALDNFLAEIFPR